MSTNFSNTGTTLEDLNDHETGKRTSAIVYLSIVMALGIPGNLLVMAVYFGTLRGRKGTHWMYIRAVAITDFLVCTVAIPFELYQQTHQLTFYSEGSCKFFRAVSIQLSLISALLLIAMSGNRLRNVCAPLKKQLSMKQAYASVGVVVGVSVLFCWPEGVISGISLETGLENNLTGYDCSFSDRFGGKEYTTVYSTLLMTIYLTCMLALVIIYSIVGRVVLTRAKIRTSVHESPMKRSDTERSDKNVSCTNDELKMSENVSQSNSSVVIKTKETPTKGRMNSSMRMVTERHMRYKSSQKQKTSKITRIAFAISFCFVLSYLPYVAVKLNASVVKGNFTRTPVTDAIFPILARTFVLNNIINPVIYGFLDNTFRQQSKQTIRYLLRMER